MTSEELANAALWEQAVCLECETVSDPGALAMRECPNCGSDAIFAARDLEKIESWLATLDRPE